jgi:hypothetical protein
MDRIEELRIEPISKSHNRQDFNSSRSSLNEYLKKHARQNNVKNIAKTFIAVNAENKILGYYSLSTSSIEFEELSEEFAKQLPHYPVPAALVARLAVDYSCHTTLSPQLWLPG